MAIIEYIASFVGFALIVYFAVRRVAPPLSKAMRQQQDVIRKQVEDSKATSERLAAAEKQYRDAVAEARTEAAKIRDGARADAQRIVVEMREQAEREVERIRQRAQDDIVAQRQQVIRELRTRIGELSVEMASQLIDDHLADPAHRTATVDRLLDELESMAATEPTGEQAASGTTTPAASRSSSGGDA